MGYCSRCGEILGRSGTKCPSCGGINREPSVRKALDVLTSSSPNDKWSSKYTKDASFYSPSSLSPKANNNASHNSSPKAHTPYYRKTLASRENIPPHNPAPTGSSLGTPNKRGIHFPYEDDPFAATAPKSPDLGNKAPEFTRVFGTVLDPEKDRHRWRCHDCHQVFVKDETIYPHPKKTAAECQAENFFYCRGCYINQFSSGNCVSCGKAVLGEVTIAGEASTIQFEDKLWHKECCVCIYCDISVSSNPTVGLYGELVCNDCFDNAAWLRRPSVPNNASPHRRERSASPPKPDTTRRSSIISNNNHDGSAASSPSKSSPRVISPSVAHLRKTFQDLGLESPSSRKASSGEQESINIRNQSQEGLYDKKPSSNEYSNPPSPIKEGEQDTSIVSENGGGTSGGEICASCSGLLFSIQENGNKIVRIPATGEKYHYRCFCCAKCSMAIGGDLEYVQLPNGDRLHSSCCNTPNSSPSKASRRPPVRVLDPQEYSPANRSPYNSNNASPTKSSYPRRPRTSATFSPAKFGNSNISPPDSPTKTPSRSAAKLSSESSVLSSRPPRLLPNFGGLVKCPVCSEKATILETVSGPSGTRVHPRCLACHVCKTSLDANAKVNDQNKLICRSCLYNSRWH